MFRRRKHELERELRAHIELESEEQQDCGLSPEEARYAAKRALGNETLIKEEVRRMWQWNSLERLWQELLFALRILRKTPGFTITALLTLVLGIGASTAVFTVVDSVILKPLEYPHSGKLVAIWEHVRFLGSEATGPNPRHEDLWQKRAAAFEAISLVQNWAEGLSIGQDHPRLVGTVFCDPNLLDVLQVMPMIGRNFRPEDNIDGRDRVAVITYSIWQNFLHGDPDVIGKTIRLGDTPREVIGVLPASFHFPNGATLRAFRSKQPMNNAPEPAIFVPAAINLDHLSWNGDYGNWFAIGRLRSGIGIQQAEAQLNTIEAQIVDLLPASERPRKSGSLSVSVQPLHEAIIGESKAGLWLLMAAVLGLMLIACVNLANAQLGRALSRQGEAAVRAALGASKSRLLWSALTEHFVLGVIGGLGGVLFAALGVKFFQRSSPISLPRMSEIHVNLAVLFFSAGLTVGASILFGLLPALRFIRADPQAALQQTSGRTLGFRQGRQIRTGLIGVQVFGCTVLLLVTALFSQSLIHLLHENKGFDAQRVAIAEVRLPNNMYGKDESRIAFDDAVLNRLRGVAGVESAGLISAMPLEGETWIEGLHRVDRPDQNAPLINLRWVSSGYFEAMRERLIAGRFFDARDGNLNGVILSEGEAKALWGNENPIGGQVETEGRKFSVIGIAADSRTTSVKTAPAKMAYLQYTDRPPYTTVFVARGKQSADQLVASMRQAIWSYAPDVTITRVKTLASQLDDSLATERFQTFTLVSFGFAALLLAMLGIYGILSYTTEMRKQEIGMRVALGATRPSIYALTLADAGHPVLGGLLSGLLVSFLAAKVVRNQLYGINGVSPSLMFSVAALFLAAAVVAAFVPARRAASFDPMSVLRHE
jgi:putative ABC transport system permease protein